MLTITNEDNMALMARYPDKYFDLAIVDPPYGIMKVSNKVLRKNKMGVQKWDVAPDPKYFDELFRVSKNQLIFGANHLGLRFPKTTIFWNKKNYNPLYGDGELIFYYGNLKSMKEIKRNMGGCIMIEQINRSQHGKIHPTEKTPKIYEKLLYYFARPGDKILDTHLGSGSIAIACHDYGYDLTACELDESYYESAMKRISEHESKLNLFNKAS